MADSRRAERVAALIRREVSDLLTGGIRDARVQQGLVSLTDVEVSGDLQHCRISVSIYGSEADREAVLEGLRSAAPFVRGELARRLHLRRAPEVVFRLDRSLEQGSEVLGLLRRLEEERRHRGQPTGGGADGTP